MATDFLIFGLLLVSFSINLLALGAFWVTPGLRTTANRFVINLLVVNLVGCVVLAPTLFLNNPDIIEEDILKIKIKSNHLSGDVYIRRNISTTNSTEVVHTMVQCSGDQCEKITIADDPSTDTIVITEMDIKADPAEGLDLDGPKIADPSQQATRCWSLDLAAALGALSVLLVVGDTWCAVTDPLRYHSRISGLKSWVLIGITWTLGILFGVLSALRGTAFNTTLADRADLEIPTEDGGHDSGAQGLESGYRPVTIQANDLYDMVFSCVYFVLIILLPFGFVCGMYWRIFSEARENGLRVRQNGSSPLLQSALNLSTHSNVHHGIHSQVTKESLTAGGLTLKIDRRRSSDREVIKPLLFPVAVHRPSQQSNSSSDEKPAIRQDRNQNILLTLSAANEEIRRNYSARQLSLLGASDEDVTQTSSSGKQGIRHVHSTPNLQKSHEGNGFAAAMDHSHNALQLPTIQASPKALSYMTSIRHRLSNASSLFKYREESRAARISILVVIMFLVSYLPYGLLVLLQSRLTNLLGNWTQIAVLMVLLGNLSSPFIFAYRNKRVRRGVKRLFGLDSRSRDSKFHRTGAGGLLRAGTKASINVRRSASKASTYSVNSCKFLAPHAVNNGTFLMEIEQCHYLSSKNQCQTNSIDKALKEHEKRSILKMVCDSSRKLGCATNSCATSDNEQTDV